MNDKERENWVMNEEGLYLDWRRSRLSMRRYIRSNRELIDSIINAALNQGPRERQWYDVGNGE